MAIKDATPVSAETKDLLERFANHLYARRGMAESSTTLVTGYIRRMLPETGAHPTQEELERYIAAMRRRKVSYGNLVNCLRAVELYMTFLGDPIRFSRPRRPITAELKVLSEGKIGDIDIGQASLTIRAGKGDHGRIVPLAGECVEILMDYLRERNGRAEDPLFVTVRHGHQMQTQDVRKLIRVVAKRAGVAAHVWPHLFRHSLATAMLDRGASIYSIQAILGHTFISTTMDYYLHPGSRNVRADYHRCAPSFV